MKKTALILLFCGLAVQGWAIIPSFFGARSLAMGNTSTAFNYDINSIFLNPSILCSIDYTLTGYQYQHNYMDYKNFGDTLSEILKSNIANYESLAGSQKVTVLSKLKELYQSKLGMYGFRSNIPGYISQRYGIAVSMVNTAIINPTTPTGNIFDKEPDQVTNQDIAALKMNILGLSYKQFSISYGMPIYQDVNIGITMHYLAGKLTEFDGAMIDSSIFSAGKDPKDYLEYGWGKASEKFKKFAFDAGMSVSLGRFFSVGITVKNFTRTKIKTQKREITLQKRITAGLSFRPDTQWGIYLDVDVKKADLLYNGKSIQPISFGIEKGFFKNYFFLRAGMTNDLTEKHFFGNKSNVMYGLGFGFNMKKIIIDGAIGLDKKGAVKSLAISGYIVIK